MGVRVLAAVARRSVLMGVAGLTLVLASCGGAHDSAGGLTKEDYEALKARRPAPDVRTLEEPPIPDLQPILAAPQPPSLADSRRVSVQATEPTSVRDLLIEIARRADIDLELDPRIEGGVIITARDRPVADVIDRLADLAGLRYEFKDNRLRVELDEPYLDSYRVDILSLRRQTETEIASSTDVFSAVGESSAAAGNLSSVSVRSSSDADVWTEISSNIETILSQALPAPRTTTSAPAAASAAGTATPAQGNAAAAGTAGAGASPAGAAATAPGQPASPADMQQQAAALASGGAATSGDAAAPAAGEAAAPAATAAPAAEGNGHYFIVNRQAGIVNAYTTQRQHQKIARYLKEVQRNTQAQVLIEAKIVEVLLRDEFRAGINWDTVFNNTGWLTGGRFNLNLAEGVTPSAETVATGVISASRTTGGATINSALEFVSRFGTTRTLSSPRLTALNNQNAVLKVAENEVYFTIEIEREYDSQSNRYETRYQSEIHTVPIGVILNVQPSINLDTGEISMSLRPTISRIARTVDNPAIALVVAQINENRTTPINLESPVPVVEVRELDSVVTLRSGDVAVMGGLMQERVENVEEGVPGVKDVPLIGAPFRKEIKDTQVVELVIFLRATIVNGRDSVHPADVELYNKFTPDPRPIAF